ncbi:hypothetical protein [Methyloceanibacter sp.]|jgi:hypothetical protein|uniref:hypothetical protein n=1 Tax=Methyloceanibacter sp. TaxID=1965321 RepID=UPI00351B6420
MQCSFFSEGAVERRVRTAGTATLIAAAATTLLLALGAAAAEGSIAIELNKLEPQGKTCRAYIVIQNKGTTNYQELKLDIVLFKADGVIGKRFAVDLAPLKADKRTVKLFDIEDTACEEVGSFLINDVMECKAETGPLTDCLKDLNVSSRTNVELTK